MSWLPVGAGVQLEQLPWARGRDRVEEVLTGALWVLGGALVGELLVVLFFVALALWG